MKIKFLLMATTLAYWLWVLSPFYTIPSQDDGLNHLAYVDFLRRHGTWALGHVPYPHGNEFGAGHLVFYPVGMHAILAFVASLLSWLGFEPDLALLLKITAALFMSLIPVFLFSGIKKIEPKIDHRLALLTAASLSLLQLFPAHAIGEGGLPRIMAQVLALPVAFAAIAGSLSKRRWVFCITGVTPILFYIHPSSFFVLYPALLLAGHLKTSRDWILSSGAAILGAILCLLPMKTGEIHLSQMGIGAGGMSLGWVAAVLDRFKGVFHFLFSDPHGLFKFMSVRSLLVYIGVIVLIIDGTKRRRLWTLASPFLISLCMIAPWGWLQTPGGFFYQAVKRIAEVGLLPLAVCGAAGAAWLQRKSENYTRSLGIVLGLLAVWTGVSVHRSRITVHQMSKLFSTPRAEEATLLDQELRDLPSGTVVVSDQQWFGMIRGLRPDLEFVGSDGECKFSKAPACIGRQSFIEAVKKAREEKTPIRSNHFAGKSLYFAERRTGSPFLSAIPRN